MWTESLNYDSEIMNYGSPSTSLSLRSRNNLSPKPVEGWQTYTYRNEEYGFEVIWIDSWNVWKDYKVFEEQLINNAGKDFIFAVPVASSDISENYFRALKIRILLKEASGGYLSEGYIYLNTDGIHNFYYAIAQDAPAGMDVKELNIIGSVKILTDKSGTESPGWKKFRFEFQYPKSWGEVEFGEAFASDSKFTDARGLRQPESGGKFVGNFTQNEKCGFGGITTDYGYGSEGNFYDFAGWREENGRYYSLWPNETIRDPNLKYVTEIVPDDVIDISTGKALIFDRKPIASFEDEDAPDSEILIAVINLPGPVFNGLSIFCYSSSESPEVSSEDRQGFYQILSTFKFID